MASGAAEMILGCVFEGSISMHDMEIERRPYHKNCGCALHKQKGATSSSNRCPRYRNIKFPKKHSWSDLSITIATRESLPSPFSLPGRKVENIANWVRFCQMGGIIQTCQCLDPGARGSRIPPPTPPNSFSSA